MNQPHTHDVGSYLVTPMSRQADNGAYMASVSIRRGMYDRVYRLIPRFDSAAQALSFAFEQASEWIHSEQHARAARALEGAR